MPNATVKAHVGYAYVSDLESLPATFQDPSKGQVRGLPMKVNRISLQVERTRGISAGPSDATVVKWRQLHDLAGLHLQLQLFTGVLSIHVDPLWTRDGTVWVKQIDPLPMTVLGIAPELTVGK